MTGMRSLGFVVVALLALTVPASASGALAKLHLYTSADSSAATDQPIVPGQNIHVETQEAIVATNLGNITCVADKFPYEEGFVGADQTNDRGTDKITLERSVQALAGQGGACSGAGTLGPNAYVKIYNPASPTHVGNLLLRSDGIASIKSLQLSEPIYVELRVSEGRTKCLFTAVALKGTVFAEPITFYNPYERVLEQVFLRFNQKLRFNESLSDPGCPKTATFTIPKARLTSWEGEGFARFVFETGLS